MRTYTGLLIVNLIQECIVMEKKKDQVPELNLDPSTTFYNVRVNRFRERRTPYKYWYLSRQE
jgi:hypothetical protein